MEIAVSSMNCPQVLSTVTPTFLVTHITQSVVAFVETAHGGVGTGKGHLAD